MKNYLSYSTEYANLYDIITAHKDYRGEVLQLLKVFESANSIRKKAKILSIGCGTGSHEILLAQNGYNVLGIDSSICMIDIARSKSHPSLQFKHSTIQEYAKLQPKSADIVISLFNVINCLSSIKELVDFFASVNSVLKQHGVVYFECWNMLPCILQPPVIVKRVYQHPDGNYLLTRIAKPSLRAIDQKLTIDYEITGKLNGEECSVSSTHDITLFSWLEIRHALEVSGFSRINFSFPLHTDDLEHKTPEYSRMVSVFAHKSDSRLLPHSYII